MSATRLVSATSAVLLLAGLAAGSAAAQTAPANPVQQQPRDPNMPSQQNTLPEKIDSTSSTRTLSDKLEATGGVITPPAGVDPGITIQPPVSNPNTTPVIPPGSIPQQTK